MIEYSRIKDKFHVYKDQIIEITKKKIYAYDRYGIEFSALMIYSHDPIEIDVCKINPRQSDHLFSLEENLYVVIYDVIKPENAIKAAQNILHAYHQHNVKQELFVVIAQAEEDSTAYELVNCLFTMLEYAVKENHPNTVIDANQLSNQK